MPVTRSALASSAARSRQRRVGADQRRDHARPVAPAAARARPGCRVWRGTSPGPAPARGFPARALRSRSQKCRASAKRARSTRSLPAMMAAPPSLGRDVGDEGELRRGRPVGVAQREIALVDAHRDLHHLGRQVHVLGGRCGPSSTTGHSTSPATSSSRPGSSTTSAALPRARSAMPVGDHALAVGGIDQHAAVAQFGRPVGGAEHGEARRGRGSGGPRSGCRRPGRARRRRRRAGRTAPRRRPAGRRCGAAGAPR